LRDIAEDHDLGDRAGQVLNPGDAAQVLPESPACVIKN
jgi:hypothetical protein